MSGCRGRDKQGNNYRPPLNYAERLTTGISTAKREKQTENQKREKESEKNRQKGTREDPGKTTMTEIKEVHPRNERTTRTQTKTQLTAVPLLCSQDVRYVAFCSLLFKR